MKRQLVPNRGSYICLIGLITVLAGCQTSGTSTNGRKTLQAFAAVEAIPGTRFDRPGSKELLLRRFELAEELFIAGKNVEAARELISIRLRMDGCGSNADENDWIIDCATQLQIRTLIDEILSDPSCPRPPMLRISEGSSC